MIPTKYASRDTNSAASPRNETTKLRALATGLRLRTTAAPKISVISAKIQKRNGDIGYWSNGVMAQWKNEFESRTSTAILQYSTTPVLLISSCSTSTRRHASLRRLLCHPERSEGSHN